jgi:RNA polymerase sigma factor (sigma-70 family)
MKFEKAGGGSEEHDPLSDESTDPEKIFERGELRGLIEKRISRLTGKHQQEVARRIFLEGDSRKDVAADLGVTPERIREIEARIIRSLSRVPAEIKPYLPKREK